MTIPARLERAASQAARRATVEVPLAAQPALYCEGTSERLSKIAATLSLQDVIQFATETNNASSTELSAMAIVLRDARLASGSLTTDCQTYNNKLHYPILRLGISPRTSVPYINFILRHELRHAFQPNRMPLYLRPKATHLIRWLGIAGTVASGVCLLADIGPFRPDATNFESVVAPIVSGLTNAAAISPGSLAWTISRQEWDATAYAFRTRGFSPIQG